MGAAILAPVASRGRTRALAVAAVLAAVIAGLAGCSSGATKAAEPAAVIPFTAAGATQQGRSYQLTWSAPSSAGTVAVYASTSSRPDTTAHRVGSGSSTGSLRIGGLTASGRWYFTLVPAHGADLTVAPRSLGLSDAPNLRDIGGYRTADGQWVREGVVYRSDALSSLTQFDQQTLTQLGLRVVVDLRTSAEAADAPDRLPSGVELEADNVMAGEPSLVSEVATDTVQLLGHPTGPGDPTTAGTTATMEQFYEAMVTLPSARQAYASLYRDIAGLSSGSLVLHCTAGKDRTGWGAAALLLELGVPKATVLSDFLLSNTYALDDLYRSIFSSYVARGGDPATLRAILGVQTAYFTEAYDTMISRYGSVGAYFTKGLGLSQQTISSLRTELLVGTAGS